MTKQQIILVTGASSGFGLQTSLLLAKRGHIVYGTSRKVINDQNEGLRMLQMDVTDSVSIQTAVNKIIAEQGRIDVVVNNAGVGISGALELATDEEVAWQMNTNFIGVARICSAVLPFMRKAKSGKIINISSIGGVIAVPFQGLYSASKFAIEGYSEALATEVYPFGIRICLVEPGDFKTNFTANRNISASTQSHEVYREMFARTLNVIEKAERQGSNPELLAKTIQKLVNTKHPAFRTKVGPIDQVLLAKAKGMLPDRLIHYILRMFYKIE